VSVNFILFIAKNSILEEKQSIKEMKNKRKVSSINFSNDFVSFLFFL